MCCSAVKYLNYCKCGLSTFQGRGTKLERFLPKNQHILRKLLNRIGVVGRCQKVPTFDFQSQFSMSKIFRILYPALENSTTRITII